MNDYIKREDVLALIDKGYIVGNRNYNSVAKLINSIPSADVVEQKKGKWEEIPLETGGFTIRMPYCSLCGARPAEIGWYYRTNFCPNCGADMREDGEEC